MSTAGRGYETPGVFPYHPSQPAAVELPVSLYWKSLTLHVYHTSCASQILLNYFNLNTQIYFPKFVNS